MTARDPHEPHRATSSLLPRPLAGATLVMVASAALVSWRHAKATADVDSPRWA